MASRELKFNLIVIELNFILLLVKVCLRMDECEWK